MSLITPDFGLLVWMTLIFGIVFFVLAKWGFPAITNMVEKRGERIEKSIAEAREAEEMLKGVAQREEALVQKALKEKAEALRQAAEREENLVRESRQKAEEESRAVMKDAADRIDAGKRKALEEVREEAAKIGIALAEKILREKLSSESAQNALLEQLVDEMTKDE